MLPERLQKYLAQCGVSSRRSAEKLISEGKVSVNGEIVREQGVKVRPGTDLVAVEGRLVAPVEKRLYLFHKPSGVVSTMKDTHGRASLAEFVKDLPIRVFPVGRLDSDVTGLLMMTSDGQFAQELLHPSYQVLRTYWALIGKETSPSELKALTIGMVLRDGFAQAEAARIVTDRKRIKRLFGETPDRWTVVELSVSEGRNHFVKRLLAAARLPLKKLCRVKFGSYELGNLKEGELREIKAKKFS